MLARTADSLYWMSRYMERVDVVLRMLFNGYHVSHDVNDTLAFEWHAMVKTFCYLTDEETDRIAQKADNVLRLLLVEDATNSLKELVSKARENARGAQDHLTKEVWEAINEKYHSATDINIVQTINEGGQVNLLIQQINETLIYNGVFENTMPRGEGWSFMNLGRFIERTIQTLNLAEAKFQVFSADDPESIHILYWKNLLLNLSGYELYLKSYRGGNHSENIIDMLFLNKSFPRSILYSLNKIRIYINNIIRENDNLNNRQLEKKTGMLFSRIAYADLEDIQRKQVLPLIKELKSDLFDLSQLIGHSFFSYY